MVSRSLVTTLLGTSVSAPALNSAARISYPPRLLTQLQSLDSGVTELGALQLLESGLFSGPVRLFSMAVTWMTTCRAPESSTHV